MPSKTSLRELSIRTSYEFAIDDDVDVELYLLRLNSDTYIPVLADPNLTLIDAVLKLG